MMELGTMADLTANLTPEQRARIDAIKAEMVAAERQDRAARRARHMRAARSWDYEGWQRLHDAEKRGEG
ncbi:hypothetical protein [Embleya sp. AB8]|uniref:hypothetical protein n=1 Tax=Embleya sp. AB8 TaxID=3156304 RepID=UPI003C74F89B